MDKDQLTKLYVKEIVDGTHRMEESEKYLEMVDIIKDHGEITKRELYQMMGWGRGIKWTPYRRALMEHPNIFDTTTSESTYIWKE